MASASIPAFTPAQYRRLGRSELMVTPVCLGGAFIGQCPDGEYDDELAVDTFQQAMQLGVNAVDTSPLYGESERRIGLALRRWFAAGGRRQDIVVCSKTGTRVKPHDYSAAHTRDSVRRSLELLGLDYLDICFVHDPDRGLEPVLAPGGALEALEDLQAEKVVRHIGLGAQPHAYHQRLIASGRISVGISFGDFHLLRTNARQGVLQPARAADTGLFLASVLDYGLLAGGDPQRAWDRDRRARNAAGADDAALAARLWDWCRRRDLDLLALNLQYCLREPGCSALLMGASAPEHIAADVAVVQAPIPASVWDELSRDFGIANG